MMAASDNLFLVVLATIFELCSVVLGQSWSLSPYNSVLLPGASQSCIAAYTANVTCAPEVETLYDTLFDDKSFSEVQRLCTTACQQSITAHRSKVASECRSAEYYDPFLEIYYEPTVVDDRALYAYSIACLKKRSARVHIALLSTANFFQRRWVLLQQLVSIHTKPDPACRLLWL